VVQAPSNSNDLLSPDYVESLRAAYHDQLFRQEVLAEFVDFSTTPVYAEFDEARNVRPIKFVKNDTIFVGMDFNVNPMTAVFAQHLNGRFYVFDEIFLQNSRTELVIDEIIKRYGHGLTIVPDATGAARKTSSAHSDINLLKNAGFRVLHSHNPAVIDRTNNVNRLLANGKIIVDPSCTHLIKDFQLASWKANGQLDKTSDPLLNQIADGFGYLAWKLDPIRRNYGKDFKITFS